jgi:hypothetical protein
MAVMVKQLSPAVRPKSATPVSGDSVVLLPHPPRTGAAINARARMKFLLISVSDF